MDSNVLKSYLVSLGFSVNEQEFQKMSSSLQNASKNVQQYTAQISKHFVQATTEIVTSLASVTTATAAMIDKVVQADIKYQNMALTMHMSVEATRQMDMALKAMGTTIEAVAWNPEQRQQYFALLNQQRQMSVGAGGEAAFKDARNVRFEFTRMKIEAEYSLMWISYMLIEKLGGPLGNVKDKLKNFNDYITTHMPQIADKIANWIIMVINLFKTVIHYVEITKGKLEELWGSLTKGQKHFVEFGAVITAFFTVGTLGKARIAVTTLLLAFDDLYAYMDGRKSSKELGPIWQRILQFSESWQKADMNKSFNKLNDSIVQCGKSIIGLIKQISTTMNIDFSDSSLLKSLKQVNWGIELILEQFSRAADVTNLYLKGDYEGAQRRAKSGDIRTKQLLRGMLSENYDPDAEQAGGYGTTRTWGAGNKEKKSSFSFGMSTAHASGLESGTGGGGYLNAQPGLSSIGGVQSPISGGGGYDDVIREASQIYGVSEDMIRRVMQTESSNNPNAISGAGAIGLMQLMPDTAAGLGVNPYDPVQNIMGGTHYLAQMYANEGNWPDALRAYNGGPGWRTSGAAGTLENQEYAGKVLGGGGGGSGGLSTGAQNFQSMTGGNAYQNVGGGNYVSHTTIGDVSVHVNQPNANEDQIYLATLNAIQDAARKQNARNINEFSGVVE